MPVLLSTGIFLLLLILPAGKLWVKSVQSHLKPVLLKVILPL